MTTEPTTNPTPETPAPTEAAAPAADRMRYVIPAVLSTLLTLVALAPVAYVINRNMPARVATVDLQVLVEEDQKRTLDVIGKGGDVTDEQRAVAQKLTIDFAKKLSATVDALGQECNCVIVNKAALLGGVTIDYTDQVRARMK
ncbi:MULTISPECIES: hypothetical protein [Burkholderiales]|jgi:hypothetical protein|uniref:Uncharacterized protein n=2 Tax=Burkholderiales TaxID=80840 RepID=A0A643FND1_9BURK|nr:MULTISPECIES: hypothetical protein [Burkholderiales]UOB07549.1 hypothetical protein MRB47_19895 [[Acidovorax] ebreus]BCZ16628.1 hypothetical protein CTYAZ2_49530 [Comamonas testosteroni]MBL5980220.1 hypothetical protein [Comamonas sp. NyZ500]PRE84164.1 hypothetical protein C6Q02_14310 [Burkholderia multivorans]QOT82395.1 hypothetical protein F7R26_040035 [Cupriavidus basilensis]